MDVREKLVELLNNSFAEQYEKRGLLTAPHTATDLIAHGVTVQEWISVNDRLPVLHIDDYQEPDGSRVQFEVSEDQWVFTASGHKTKARYETGAVFQGWVGDYGETIRDVTHWMPLPQPPKGENETIFCKDCEHLMFSDCYGECSKGHKGIVKPNDTCKYATRKLPKGE